MLWPASKKYHKKKVIMLIAYVVWLSIVSFGGLGYVTLNL